MDSASVCSTVPVKLISRLNNLLLAGLVVVRVASLAGVSYLPQRLGPAAPTWMTHVDILVHLHKLGIQVLPFPSLDTLADSLPHCMPVLRPPAAATIHCPSTLVVWMKERSVPSSPSRSVNPSTSPRITAFGKNSLSNRAHYPVHRRPCPGPSSCTGRLKPRTTNCTVSSSCCHRRTSAKPTKCNLHAEIGGSEGTRTTACPVLQLAPRSVSGSPCSSA